MSIQGFCHCGRARRANLKHQTIGGNTPDTMEWKYYCDDGNLVNGSHCAGCGDYLDDNGSSHRMVRANYANALKEKITVLENKIATMAVQCPLKTEAAKGEAK